MPMYSYIHNAVQQLKKYGIACQLCDSIPSQPARLCQDCWQQLPWLRETVKRQEMDILVACHYDYPISQMLQQFKYEQQLHYRYPLAAMLLSLKLPKVQAILPMPISQDRLIERGYNQSLVLAQSIAKQLKLPIWQPIIRAEQHAQKGLNRLERLENIDHQFQLSPHQHKRYKHVLLLDDVVTTGSSLKALKDCLEQHFPNIQVHPICLSAANAQFK